MRKVLTKVFSILLCTCLVSGFMPGVLAVNPTSESFVHDGVTYNVAISYSEDGQKIATVTGGDVIASAKLENGTVTVTQTNIRTGETTTTANSINSITQAPATASIEEALDTQVINAKKSTYFNVGYEVSYSSAVKYWMVWNSQDMSKAVNSPPTDANLLNNFQLAVNSCCAYEKEFEYAVGDSIITSVANALAGRQGLEAIASVLGLFGIPLAYATYWDNAQTAAALADQYYYDI